MDLRRVGFKRWTKDDLDRMYIDPTDLGLSVYYNQDGEIRMAYWAEKPMTNYRKAARMLEAKVYLDLNTLTVVSPFEELSKAAADLIAAAIHATYTPKPYERRIQMTLDNPNES
jgi:hypothetical protein